MIFQYGVFSDTDAPIGHDRPSLAIQTTVHFQSESVFRFDRNMQSRPALGSGSRRSRPVPSRARGTVPPTSAAASPRTSAAGSKPRWRSARQASPVSLAAPSPATSARNRGGAVGPAASSRRTCPCGGLSRPRRRGQLLPVRRQERFEQDPILCQSGMILWLIHTSITHDSFRNN